MNTVFDEIPECYRKELIRFAAEIFTKAITLRDGDYRELQDYIRATLKEAFLSGCIYQTEKDFALCKATQEMEIQAMMNDSEARLKEILAN